MAIEEEVLNATTPLGDLAIRLGSIGKWLQALGLVVILWIIVHTINWWMNRKKMKTIESMKGDLERIEKKIDDLGKKK